MRKNKLYLFMKNYIFILALAAVSFSSCKKDEKVEETTKITLLTGKTWKEATSDKSPTLNPTGAEWKAPDKCTLDDVYQFDAKGKVNVNVGDLTCDSDQGDVQTFSVDYTMNAEGTEMVLNDEQYQILELTDTQLKLYNKEYTEIVLWVH